ncbi:MAG TPA: S8 family serine peptidase [Candidatus Nanoarchaeia archaeon]|nr:S8 family serine peptidase [Candidatus Nanoarchaeia archaeon]
MRSEIWIWLGMAFLFAIFIAVHPTITGRVTDSTTERVVVVLRPASSNAITGSVAFDDELSVEELREAVADSQEQVLEDVNSPGLVAEVMGAEEVIDVEVERALETVPAMIVEATPEGIEKLKDHPLVEAVYSDIGFSLSLAQSVPLVNADDVHQVSISSVALTGAGIGACILDTGIQADHPVFGSRVVAQKCFCANNCCPNGLADDTVATDTHSQSHGTHVSGILAGSNGVAPGADIVAVKVCDSVCYLSDILAGLDFCINNKDAYNIKVISGSFGDNGNYQSDTCPTYFDTAINSAYNLGIPSIFASGNNGYSSGISYPACSPNAVSVGASDKSDAMASFTNQGSLLKVLAPGVSITSAQTGSSTGTLSGTSQATPHVSGAVVLLMQYGSLTAQTFTPDQIKQALISTGVTVSSFPRIDIFAALQSLGYNATNETNETNTTVLNVTIIEPLDNSTISSNTTQLVASVSGNLTNVSIVWSSSLLGIIGFGENTSANLTEGNHTIFANASEDNLTVSANVSIQVILSNETNETVEMNETVLNVTIIEPENNSTLLANGTILVANWTGNATNVTVLWFSNISGNFANGTNVTVNLTSGNHSISAFAGDMNASISVNVLSATCLSDIDLNDNNQTDLGDMILLLTKVTQNSTTCITPAVQSSCMIDVDRNQDSAVNTGDLILLLKNVLVGSVVDIFGSNC